MVTAEQPVDVLLDAVKRLPPEALAEFTSRLAEWQGASNNGGSGQAGQAHSEPEAFVLHADRLDRAGHRNAAMDLLYDRVDEMMRNGQLDLLEAVFQRAPVRKLSIDVLLALLTSTLPVRSRVASRPLFFATARESLIERGEYEEGLLTGLE
jgi:hypothetical protein